MSRYGINYYGNAVYGSPTTGDLLVDDFKAVPFGHTQIKLTWTSPGGSWDEIRLVRGVYGFPTNPFDGVLVSSAYYGDDPGSSLDSNDLLENRFYYYSLFVYSVVTYSWVRSADASALSVKDFKSQKLLYDYIPEPYKYTSFKVLNNDETNQSLYKFLGIFGFELDKYRSFINNTTNRYDLSLSNGQLLPTLLKQFGFPQEPALGLQQSRILVRDAVQLYKEKGSSQGVKEFIKAFSGYAVPSPSSSIPNPGVDGLTVGHNLMLDYNSSSFEESYGVWLSYSSAKLTALTVSKVTHYQVTSNVLILTLNKEHGYEIGDLVSVSASSIPLLNTTSPVALTAVTPTTISFTTSFGDVPTTKTNGVVTPNPTPRAEPTTITGYANKQNGILKVSNSGSGTGVTVSLSAGANDAIRAGIPVTAGQPYTFSIYSRALATSRQVTLKIQWFDRFGLTLGVLNGSAAANNTSSFFRHTVSGTAPSDAYYAAPIISIASVGNAASGDRHYFDCAQFENSATVSEFDEARNLHITLKATRINELPNPNFKGTLAPWNILNASYVLDPLTPDPSDTIYEVTSYIVQTGVVDLTTSKRHRIQIGDLISVTGINGTINGQRTVTVVTENTIGFALSTGNVAATAVTGTVFKAGSVVKLNAPSTTTVTVESSTGLNDLIPIYYPEESYTFSIYAKSYAGMQVGVCSIYWYDATGNLISTQTGSNLNINQEWVQASVTGTSPTNCYSAKVEFNWIPAAAGDYLAIDHAMFEKTPFVLSYFDGDSGLATPDELYWEGGVADASRSHFYVNRIAVEERLKIALKDFLTLGTTFTVYLAQPKT